MIMAVAEALPRMLSDEERRRRAVYPDLANIRNISANMAVEARCFALTPSLLCHIGVVFLQAHSPCWFLLALCRCMCESHYKILLSYIPGLREASGRFWVRKEAVGRPPSSHWVS